jgi:dCTP deaminase
LILSRDDILQYLEQGKLRINPAVNHSRVAQVSVDLILDRKFAIFRDPPSFLPAIHIEPSLFHSEDLWERVEQDQFRLNPGHFVLGQTLEEISIPSDLVGWVEGRSSWARAGISVHVTAPKIDPGFSAHITLELYNFGKIPVDLRAGVDMPAQLMLFQVTTPLRDQELYGQSAQDQFQGQTFPIPGGRREG